MSCNHMYGLNAICQLCGIWNNTLHCPVPEEKPPRSQPLGLALPLSLDKQRDVIKADLLGKYQREDWHGVMDCAADLREHDAERRGYNQAKVL